MEIIRENLPLFALCAAIFLGIGFLLGIDVRNIYKEESKEEETKKEKPNFRKQCDHEFERTLVPEMDGSFWRQMCKKCGCRAPN